MLTILLINFVCKYRDYFFNRKQKVNKVVKKNNSIIIIMELIDLVISDLPHSYHK